MERKTIITISVVAVILIIVAIVVIPTIFGLDSTASDEQMHTQAAATQLARSEGATCTAAVKEQQTEATTTAAMATKLVSENLTSEIYMMQRLDSIAAELESRLKRSKVSGKTITLKIKYSDFTTQTRSRTMDHFVNDKSELMEVVKELLYQEKVRESVRLLGISMSNLDNDPKGQEEMEVQLKFKF